MGTQYSQSFLLTQCYLSWQ